jgi:energy-coupling factor transporter transmembrane protein EcfT
MLLLHPTARLAVAALVIAAIFIANTLAMVAILYAFVLAAVWTAQAGRGHFRFVTYIGLPLLAALLLVWGWAADARQIPLGFDSGISYALFNWTRIAACAGVLQCLFLPLIEHPTHLKNFVVRTGLSGQCGTLIVTAIIFLPEVRRRLSGIIEARMAQGYAVTGFAGLRQLPAVLMPLVASLLDSATKRAEFWGHRGILQHRLQMSEAEPYSWPWSAVAIGFGLVCVGLTAAT